MLRKDFDKKYDAIKKLHYAEEYCLGQIIDLSVECLTFLKINATYGFLGKVGQKKYNSYEFNSNQAQRDRHWHLT